MDNNSGEMNPSFWQCAFCLQINVITVGSSSFCVGCGLENKTRISEPPIVTEVIDPVKETEPVAAEAASIEVEEINSEENHELVQESSEDIEALIGQFEEPEMVEDDQPRKSKKKLIVLSTVAIAVVAALFISLGGLVNSFNTSEVPDGSETLTDTTPEPEPEPELEPEPVQVSEPEFEPEKIVEPKILWEMKVAAGTEIIPGAEIFAIQKDELEIYSSKTGKLSTSLPTGKKNVLPVFTKNMVWVMTPKSLWSWNSKTDTSTATKISKLDQVRILGEQAFIFSEGLEKISSIKKGKKVALKVPTVGAVPIYGSLKGQTVWATPDKKLISVSESGKKSTVKPKAPLKGAKIIRWIGADKKYSYLLWSKGKKQFFTVIETKSGKTVAKQKVSKAEKTAWRVSVDATVGLFGDYLINKVDGKISKPISGAAFDSVTHSGFLVFDGSKQKLITVDAVTEIPDEIILIDRTKSGWLMLDGSGTNLQATDALSATAHAN